MWFQRKGKANKELSSITTDLAILQVQFGTKVVFFKKIATLATVVVGDRFNIYRGSYAVPLSLKLIVVDTVVGSHLGLLLTTNIQCF